MMLYEKYSSKLDRIQSTEKQNMYSIKLVVTTHSRLRKDSILKKIFFDQRERLKPGIFSRIPKKFQVHQDKPNTMSKNSSLCLTTALFTFACSM